MEVVACVGTLDIGDHVEHHDHYMDAYRIGQSQPQSPDPSTEELLEPSSARQRHSLLPEWSPRLKDIERLGGFISVNLVLFIEEFFAEFNIEHFSRHI